MGVAQLIWLPCLASSKCTLVGHILRLIKQTSLEFRQKYSSRTWAWLNGLLLPRPLEKILCTVGSVLMYTTYSFIHKEFVECLCVNSCDLSKSEVIG